MQLASDQSADVVIAGTGIVACLIAEQALDAGLSVLMLEAGPRVDRWRIVENYRNLLPSLRLFHWDAPYPPKPWAPHLETRTAKEQEQYLQLEGPNARAYLQGYVRFAGATWHWAGICWRITPDDMRLKKPLRRRPRLAVLVRRSRALLYARRACDRCVRSELRGRDGVTSDNNASASGAALFQGNCASCHSAEGQGSKDGYYPSLFHNSATGAKNATNLIAAILYGVDRTVSGKQAFMPGFGGHPTDANPLSDRDIAALGTYVLAHYGPGDTTISEQQVGEIRHGGPTSSLLLLARGGLGAAGVVVIVGIAFFAFRRRKPAKAAG